MTSERELIKKAFFEHLSRHGFSPQHLEVYSEYFDFFLDHLRTDAILTLEPETIYQAAVAAVEELEGEEVVEAYLHLLQYFMEFYAGRWEKMQPP